MSKALRDKMDALVQYGKDGSADHPSGSLIDRSEVLRIVAEYEQDSAAVSSALAEVSTKPNPFPLSHDDAFRLAVETNEDSH